MTNKAVRRFLDEYSPRKTIRSGDDTSKDDNSNSDTSKGDTSNNTSNTKKGNVLLIVSSTSGFGNASRLAPQVVDLLLAKKFQEVTIVPTSYKGHCREIMAEEPLQNYTLAVILGGDGAFSEAINGMLSREDKTTIPITTAPGGSGCAVALNTIGVWSGTNIESAIDIISKQKTKAMDVIEMECSDGVTRYSTSCLAGGVNTDAIDLADSYRWTYYLFGPTFRYIIGTFKALWKYGKNDTSRVMKYTVKYAADGNNNNKKEEEETFEMETFAFALYNGGRVMHDTDFAQSATPFSRDMELSIGQKYEGFGAYLKYLSVLKKENGDIDFKQYPELEQVHFQKRHVTSIKVEPVVEKTPATTRPLTITLDGEKGWNAEDYTAAPFTARILPGKIQVVVA